MRWICGAVVVALCTPGTAMASSLPLGFEPNAGQTDPSVRYLGRTGDGAAFLTGSGAVLRLGRGEAVRLRPVGAREDASVTAAGRMPGVVNRLHGDDPSKWLTGLPLYRRVRQHELYPGIDLAFHFRRGALEYDWIVAPGARPSAIRLAVDGGGKLRLTRRGDLLVRTRKGVLRQRRPVAYQRVAGRRRPVEVRFVLLGTRRIGFELGRYDRRRPLVVDPVVTFSTYLGGSGYESAGDVATDAAGNAYVTGSTASLDFPVKNGADPGCGTDPEKSCNTRLDSWGDPVTEPDAFVAKLSPTGSLVYATYLGGSDYEGLPRVAVDAQGRAHVAGFTESVDFPTTAGSLRPARQCLANTACEYHYVTKLSAGGGALEWSTYFGGGQGDTVDDLAVGPDGALFVTGESGGYRFPVTPGALANGRAPGEHYYHDVYVTKFLPDGSALAYSGLFGGTSDEWPGGIAVSPAGEAVIAGGTESGDLPTTEGAHDRGCDSTVPLEDCDADAFVARVSADGLTVKQSTYVGGRRWDYATGVALDAQNRPLVTGRADSDDFPRRHELDDKNETVGAFVSRLTATLSDVDYTGFISGDVTPFDVAVSPDGGAYLAGHTRAAQLPVRDAVQPLPGSKACHVDYYGCDEGFAARIAPDGNAIRWATYVGGVGSDSVTAMAATGGGVVVAGGTGSADFPTRAALDETIGDGTCRSDGACRSDVFVTRIDEAATSGSAYDGFDRRRRLYRMNGTLHGDSSTAAGGTVWFEWTAPANRTVAFDTTGSTFDTTLTVYRGTSPSSLVQLASSDDHDATTASRAVWKAVRGRTYRIALGAKGGGGRYTLEWLGARPFNDDFGDAQVLAGANGTAGGSTVYATLERDEPGYPSGEYDSSLWYVWTAPWSGVFSFSTKGSDAFNLLDAYRGDVLGLLESVPTVGSDPYHTIAIDAVEGVTYRFRVASYLLGDVRFTWKSHAKPANDDLAAAQALTGAGGSVEGIPWAATRELQEPSHTYDDDYGGRSVWYRWTAPADGVYEIGADYGTTAVYTGTAYGNLQRVHMRGSGYVLRFGTEAGRTYLIAVDATYPFELQWRSVTTPANDMFKNAAPLAPDGGETLVRGPGSTFEPGEPEGATTTWYSWTAPANGPVTFLTPDNHDGGLAVFTGSAVDALTLVGQTKYGERDVTFDAVAGTVYRLQFRLVGPTSLVWDFGAPANDAAANAQVLSGASGTVTGTLAHATGESFETDPQSTRSVWFDWTAPSSGTTTLSTKGSDWVSTYLSVHTGSPPNPTALAASGYYGGDVTFSATAGATYRIRAWTYLTPFAVLPFRLSWNRPGSETVPPRPEVTSPLAGRHLRGGVTVNAWVYDRHEVKTVEFLAGGTVLGPPAYGTQPWYTFYWDTTKVPDGPAQLAVRAADEFGNAGTSAPVTVVVDNTPPVTSIASGPSGTTSSRTATLTFAAGEPNARYNCRIDEDWSWFWCDETLEIENLEDGPHTVEVRAIDQAGNRDLVPVRRSWTVLGDEADPAPEPEPDPEPDPELPPEETPDPTPPDGGGSSDDGGSGSTGSTIGSPPRDTGTVGGGGGAFVPLPADGGTIVSRSEDGELRISATVLTGRLSAATLRRGLPVRLSCSASCRATARLALSKGQARKVRLKPGTIARGAKQIFAGDRLTVRLRPSKRVAVALARRRGLRVRLLVDAVTPAGTRATIRRTLVVR